MDPKVRESLDCSYHSLVDSFTLHERPSSLASHPPVSGVPDFIIPKSESLSIPSCGVHEY